MRATRLVSLLLLLQTRGQLTAAEPAERLEVSIRTVHRDVEVLEPLELRERIAQTGRRVAALYGWTGH